VIDHYINGDSTINLAMVDLSKAFDKMNHHALFLKLLNRKFSVQLINIIVHWFNISAPVLNMVIDSLSFSNCDLALDKVVYFPRPFLQYLLMTLFT